MRRANTLGLNDGAETMARISPLRGSSATALPDLVGEEALGLLLQLEVERELEVAARVAGLAQLLVHELAPAVDHHDAASVGAAQESSRRSARRP